MRKSCKINPKLAWYLGGLILLLIAVIYFVNSFRSSSPLVIEPSISPIPANEFSDLVQNWPNFSSTSLGISFKYPPEYSIEEKTDPTYGSSVTIKSSKNQMVLSRKKKIVGYGGDTKITFTDISIIGKPVILFNKPLRREQWQYPDKTSYFTEIQTPDDYSWNFIASFSFTKITPENEFYYYDLILSTIDLK